MAKTYYLGYFVCFCLWNVRSTGADAETNPQTGCQRVQQEYLHQRIGPSGLIPDNPVYDGDISICFNAASKDKSQLSCCTRKTELSYVTAAEKYLRDTIRTKNAYLKKLVMDHIYQYEERLEFIIRSSFNRTSQLLNDIYNIPSSEHVAALNEFYEDLRTYLRQKHVSLYGSVNALFDSLFPYVYKNTLQDGSMVSLTQDNLDCLKNKRQDITPNPFGYIPYNISHRLNKALSTAKSYMDVLTLLVEAINTTDHVMLTEKCQHAVTRLQFCSHCQNLVDLKPCKGFCLNSMRRCLAQLSVISSDWNGLIMSVGRLQGWMAQKFDAEHTLNNLVGKIDSAVLYSMKTHHLFKGSIKSVCNFEVTANPRGTLPTPTLPTSFSSSSLKTKREIGGEMYEKTLEVMKELLTSLKMFDTIADDICEQQIFYEQDDNSTECWNGMTKDRYSEVVEDIQTLAKKTALVIDPQLISLKDKLAAMRVNLMTRYSDYDYATENSKHHMMADSFKYGSGDHHHNGIILTDDEDLYGNSDGESGSGSGHTPSVDVEIGLLPTTKATRVDNQKGNSASHVMVSMTLLMITTFVMIVL